MDVREDEEWDRGHAAGAVHIPLGDLEPATMDTAVPVITICRSGKRSGKAAERLAAAGFQVRNMVGGMSAWHEQGLPMVRDDGSAGALE
ncbi:rhodanese-like domain-containing protein [Allobranchiibius sp. GilTou73]|uniref:rhodanese-like domain-containing protein n=1 Tax=Allobranchiibius sp. GilTou73 TaxID=2904523 RepID=UPI002105C347|nr:rhodanese-like domain-containing protein [Allobranchiibius sp. GilTou73]